MLRPVACARVLIKRRPRMNLPEPPLVLKALETYLSFAYDSPPPVAVRSVVSTVRAWAGPFYNSPVFARTGDDDAPRYTLRLGNRHYAHMKLALEPSPDRTKYLFKA